MDKSLTTVTFDYSVIEDKDAKSKLVYLEGQIKKRHAGMADSIVEIGKELATAQAVLANNKNGVFQKWVEDACGLSKSTAYNYINVFERFGKYRPTVGRYQERAIYLLAAPNAPEKAVSESLKLADKGIFVSDKLAKELIDKHTDKLSPPPKPKPSITPTSPATSTTVAEQLSDSVREEEVEEPKELSTQEKCDLDNKDIESFCRELTKFFDDKLPKVVWIDSQGRVGSARSSLKACCNTLRQSKSTLCPKCDDGQTKKGECSYCKGYGYLPKLMADALGGEA